MYTLLAICLVLHPMRIDESVHSQLREKFQDKMLRMQKGLVFIACTYVHVLILLLHGYSVARIHCADIFAL